jgi:hypothetical protein
MNALETVVGPQSTDDGGHEISREAAIESAQWRPRIRRLPLVLDRLNPAATAT